MELKALFWTVIIAGLLAVGMLLFVVREQMRDRSRSSQTGLVCLSCDSRP